MKKTIYVLQLFLIIACFIGCMSFAQSPNSQENSPPGRTGELQNQQLATDETNESKTPHADRFDKQLQSVFEYLPVETESLVVMRGPFANETFDTISSLPISPEDDESEPNYDPIEVLSLVRFMEPLRHIIRMGDKSEVPESIGPATSKLFKQADLQLVVFAATRCRDIAPLMLENMDWRPIMGGDNVCFLEFKQPFAKDFVKSYEQNASQVIKRDGQPTVIMYDESALMLEIDISHDQEDRGLFIAVINEKLLVYGTKKDLILSVLQNDKKQKKCHLLSDELIAWKYVDTSSRLWGIRQYNTATLSETDYMSLLYRDSEVQWHVFHLSHDRPVTFTIRIKTDDPDAEVNNPGSNFLAPGLGEHKYVGIESKEDLAKYPPTIGQNAFLINDFGAVVCVEKIFRLMGCW